MRKLILLNLLWLPILIFQSCKKDSLPAPPIADQSFIEEFDTAAAAISRDWKFINTSNPKGSNVWQNGGNILPFFNAYSNNGSNVGFIGADYTSTSAEAGIISNWLVSPPVLMQNGDKIIFYTRAQTLSGYDIDDSTDYANRLQLYINSTNQDMNVGEGNDVDDTGNFNKLLLDINPDYYEWHKEPGTYNDVIYTAQQLAHAYPQQWTRFEATVSGLSKPEMRRFAFRYLVEEGGSNGRGSGIGIDRVSYTSTGY
ncbi:MAG: choice-of-anchor J domain-containing protein [Chitinophagaceae bacterium]|nr:choice-of-anchor J domain-containing protein [Chitinophagaceae bacterium]